MIIYFIPLILLAILAYIENLTNFSLKIKNKYFYSFIFLFFILFVGLRHQIGCDWDVYEINFNEFHQKISLYLKIKKSSMNWISILHNYSNKLT